MIVTQVIRGQANSQQQVPQDIAVDYPCTITLLNRGTGTVQMAGAEILSPLSDGDTSKLQLPVSGPKDLAMMVFQSDQPLLMTTIITW